MSGFSDPILDGSGSLTTRDLAKSPGYVANTTGWGLYKNGNADLNNVTIRGTVVISNSGQSLFVYNGTPALGNLMLSIASVGGRDSYGNYYPQGLAGFSLGPFTQIGEVNGAQTQATKFIEIQASALGQDINFQPDVNTYSQGSISTVTGNGHLIITAPQLKLDTENAASITLQSANPASSGNAQISFQADKYTFATLNDTVNITTNGAVQVDPANGGLATHAFIAGTIGSGSVNWYRFAANTWGSDDSVHIPDGQGYFVGTGYDSSAAFASSRANATDDGFSVRVNGDTNSRWVVTSQGINHWGPGGATAIDTTIQRESAGVMGVNGAWISHGKTWQTPSLTSDWAIGDFNGLFGGLRYRVDAEDNLVIIGAVHMTNAAGITAGTKTITSSAIASLPAVSWCVTAAHYSSGNVFKATGQTRVTSAGALQVVTGTAIAQNDNFYFQMTVPLGNIS